MDHAAESGDGAKSNADETQMACRSGEPLDGCAVGGKVDVTTQGESLDCSTAPANAAANEAEQIVEAAADVASTKRRRRGTLRFVDPISRNQQEMDGSAVCVVEPGGTDVPEVGSGSGAHMVQPVVQGDTRAVATEERHIGGEANPLVHAGAHSAAAGIQSATGGQFPTDVEPEKSVGRSGLKRKPKDAVSAHAALDEANPAHAARDSTSRLRSRTANMGGQSTAKPAGTSGDVGNRVGTSIAKQVTVHNAQPTTTPCQAMSGHCGPVCDQLSDCEFFPAHRKGARQEKIMAKHPSSMLQARGIRKAFRQVPL